MNHLNPLPPSWGQHTEADIFEMDCPIYNAARRYICVCVCVCVCVKEITIKFKNKIYVQNWVNKIILQYK